MSSGRIRLVLKFPYGSGDMSAADWDRPHLHLTCLTRVSRSGACILRVVDDQQYFVSVRYPEGARIEHVDRHSLVCTVAESATVAEFTCCRGVASQRRAVVVCGGKGGGDHTGSSSGPKVELWSFREHGSGCRRAGAPHRSLTVFTAIQCRDQFLRRRRARRNSWVRQVPLEMHWWHAAHALNRPYLLERSLWWYQSIHSKARELAADQGYTGARWPRWSARRGTRARRRSLLFSWQQLIQYSSQSCATGRGATILSSTSTETSFDSAEFMASFAHYDAPPTDMCWPPVIPQENHKPEITINPAFELRY